MLIRLLVIGFLVSACAGSGPTANAPVESVATTMPSTGVAPETFEIIAVGFLFNPKEVTVPVGTEITFVNEDDIDHTATSGTPGSPNGTFDLELPERGARDVFVFENPGSFEFFCSVHTHMRGLVEVVEE